MAQRHKWGLSGEAGYVQCQKCGLEVRESDRKRGGLGPCVEGKWKIKKEVKDSKSTLVKCPKCQMTVPNNIFCLYCSNQLHPLGYNPNSGRLPP